MTRLTDAPTVFEGRAQVSRMGIRKLQRAGSLRIGISGWRYPPWRGGAFYPKGLAQRRELEYASRALPSIEINEYEDVTADFVYIRLHGDEELYRSAYMEEALTRWAERIRLWSQGAEPPDARRISAKRAERASARDVYCYFRQYRQGRGAGECAAPDAEARRRVAG